MTYSIDIINLGIFHYNNKMKKTKLCELLNIDLETFDCWYYKYKYYFENNIQIKQNIYDEIKKNNIHKSSALNRICFTNSIMCDCGLIICLLCKQIRASSKKHKFNNLIINYVNENLGCNLKDINTNITKNEISLSSICRVLKENNISRKKINTKIVCKDENKIIEDRKNFCEETNKTDFYDYISIDESSFCINQVNNYGYSKKNVEIHKIIKHKQNKLRYTLLSAINKSGIVCYKIYKESVNGEIYAKFINDNKNLFYNKTILHDNVRFHHSKIFKNYCNLNNIKLKYIPAYTPEFNPIELFFSSAPNRFCFTKSIMCDCGLIICLLCKQDKSRIC